jgi:hypothetical protein
LIVQLWIGGLVSAAIIILVFLAYISSNSYFHQYPIENITGDNSFMCDVKMRNAKFSTTIQKTPNSPRSIKDNQAIFDMLNSQSFILKILLSHNVATVIH